jgi:hypothetical protein
MEAFPADLVPSADLAPETGPELNSRYWPYTIARLVMEPDSQVKEESEAAGVEVLMQVPVFF